MKKTFILFLVLISIISFGQRKEYREAVNLFNDKKYEESLVIVDKLLNKEFGELTEEQEFYSLQMKINYYNYIKDYKKAYDTALSYLAFVKNSNGLFSDENKIKVIDEAEKSMAFFKSKMLSEQGPSSNASTNSSTVQNTETKSATDNKTVTLTVSGTGKTLEEAKLNALRSAIEQAFGAFISSKTEILNDSIVKDEVVSVTNGNIQKYDVVSQLEIPDNGYAITLKATVSIEKLTTFAESKGVTVEFKGSILAANIKQQMLNEQNEIKAISNIVGICKEILDISCDFSIVRGEPKQKNNDNNWWVVPITINVLFNKNIEQFNQYLLNSIRGIAMSQDEVSQYNQLGKKTYKIALGGSSIGGRTKDIKYYDKTINPIYHFRSMSAVVSIIDLIHYAKHAVLNFQITNGLDFVTSEKLISDLNTKKWDGYKYVYDKGYGFKIISDNLTPIFNSRCQYGNFRFTSNGPNGIFGTYNGNGNTGCGKGPSSVNKYEPILKYSDNFYYNGGHDRSFDLVYNTKYGFLTKADSDLPAAIIGDNYDESNNGYMAVISLFDFKTGNNVITFYYEDVLALADIEKVQEYKITPISKN